MDVYHTNTTAEYEFKTALNERLERIEAKLDVIMSLLEMPPASQPLIPDVLLGLPVQIDNKWSWDGETLHEQEER